jgi:predicted RNase H-like nuclease
MDRLERIARMEVIDDATAAAMRRLSGVERVRMLDAMVASGRDLMRSRVRAQHPEWSEAQVASELARRLSDVAH